MQDPRAKAMEQFCGILKIFFEKNFITTILSVIFTILTYVYYPICFVNIKNTSELLHCVFIFFILFISIKFIIIFYRFILHKIEYYKNKKQINEYNYKESIENIFKIVDGLPLEKREQIKKLINTNNNKPCLLTKNINNCLDSNNYLFVVSDFVITNETQINNYILDNTLYSITSHHEKNNTSQWKIEVLQVKLNDNIYKLLKYSHETCGKISHFD